MEREGGARRKTARESWAGGGGKTLAPGQGREVAPGQGREVSSWMGREVSPSLAVPRPTR